MKKLKIIKKAIIISGIVLIFTISLSGLFYLANKKDTAGHYYFLAKAYESQGYYEPAKTAYEKSIKLKPDPITYNALANLQEYLGDYDKAIESYGRGIKADSEDIENYFDLSRVYINKKEYEPAEANLFLLIAKSKDSAPAYGLLGTVYIETEQWDKAEESLKKSLVLSESPSGYNDLGVVYENLGKIDLAIENYDKALRIDPGFGLARNNLERLQNQDISAP